MKIRDGWKGARYQQEGGGQEASRVFNIRFETEYLNPYYDLEILEDNSISKQGLLLCGKLKPRQSSLPEFWFRWDEKEDELDVDMHGDSKHKKDWKKSKNGCTGHKATKMKKEGRHFRVSIEMPKMKVFDGVISFSLERGITTKSGLRASVEVVASKNASKNP